MRPVDTAEWLTRGTIWLALSLYVAAETARAFGRGAAWSVAARWLNAFGVTVFAGHVICAFHFHHHWSHEVAYADTARQTAELTGLNWGGGLYLNYLFGLVWLGELIWSTFSPTTHARRPDSMGWAMRVFFIFMIFNGAVVFVRSPMRWYGLVLCLLLAMGWWQRRTRADQPRATKTD